MEELDPEMEEFSSWLQEQLEVTDEEDFQTKLEALGEEGIQSAHAAFKKSKETAPAFKDGGKFSYLECLKKFKEGGSVDCGCKKTFNQSVPLSENDKEDANNKTKQSRVDFKKVTKGVIFINKK